MYWHTFHVMYSWLNVKGLSHSHQYYTLGIDPVGLRDKLPPAFWLIITSWVIIEHMCMYYSYNKAVLHCIWQAFISCMKWMASPKSALAGGSGTMKWPGTGCKHSAGFFNPSNKKYPWQGSDTLSLVLNCTLHSCSMCQGLKLFMLVFKCGIHQFSSRFKLKVLTLASWSILYLVISVSFDLQQW